MKAVDTGHRVAFITREERGGRGEGKKNRQKDTERLLVSVSLPHSLSFPYAPC